MTPIRDGFRRRARQADPRDAYILEIGTQCYRLAASKTSSRKRASQLALM